MKNLIASLRELAGLFVEDGGLALAIIAVVVVAGLVAALAPAAGWLSDPAVRLPRGIGRQRGNGEAG